MKKKIGITGLSGFVGSHLLNTLRLQPEYYEVVTFEKGFFTEEVALEAFVMQCDTIVHLAGMNRHEDPEVIFQTNVSLVRKLIKAMEATDSTPHVLFSSSTQENQNNLYGKSKKEGRELLAAWATRNDARFSGLVIPNVFGPFGLPFYNSVVATFCHQLTHDQTPTIATDAEVKLIYVGELVAEIIKLINSSTPIQPDEVYIPHTYEINVSELLVLLKGYKSCYFEKGEIPALANSFERNLFNTFRCFMPIKEYFPVSFTQHTDARGAFVEIVRLGLGGQVSFSTTKAGVTRGNHFHTRKIERFAVIKGKALIQLRKIGTEEVLDFYLDGANPAYVDMPVWYTHNISNIGEEELYTIFWINEFYDTEDADTYFENVNPSFS